MHRITTENPPRTHTASPNKGLLTVALLCVLLLLPFDMTLHAQDGENITLARIKYRGGGDWYNDPSALSNLIEFTKSQVPISINKEYDDVALGSGDLLTYPFAFMTGHGTITVSNQEAQNLRQYLQNGGFLYVDDDYGLDEDFRKMLKQVFPEEQLVELPFDHPIYRQVFRFPKGLPKIHEHDGKSPEGYGLFLDGRLALYYTYETNLSDGWANPEVHNNPAALREKALQMGANILVYALSSGR